MPNPERDAHRNVLRGLRQARRRPHGRLLRARRALLGPGVPRPEGRRTRRDVADAHGRAEDLRVELLEHDAGDEHGSAHWKATYTFTQTGRPVVNDVRATFRFSDGLIAEHVDEFGFHRWAKQALGPTGLLLGWTPIVRSATGARRASLDEFMAKDRGGHASRASPEDASRLARSSRASTRGLSAISPRRRSGANPSSGSPIPTSVARSGTSASANFVPRSRRSARRSPGRTRPSPGRRRARPCSAPV